MNNRRCCAAVMIVAVLSMPVGAKEYFVATRGDDQGNGLSQKTAFATVGHGINRLAPGDALTILPGRYFESASARISGKPDAPITIRAQRRGTVLMHGDVEVSGFQRVPGMHYAYWIDFGHKAEGVAERTTSGCMCRSSPSPKWSGPPARTTRTPTRSICMCMRPIRGIRTGTH